MTCSEWWAFEILIVLAGLISVKDQATYIILISLSNQMFEIATGLGQAACVVVGNSIGSNDVTLAKKYFRLTTSITLCIILTVSAIVLLNDNLIVGLFTKEAEIYELTVSVIPIVALKYVWDGLQAYAQGIIRALGLQNPAAIIALISAYLIQIPLACLFAFKLDMGVAGLLWADGSGMAA